MRSEQGKKEEKGTHTVVLKGERTKMTTAKVVPSKGVDARAVDSEREALGQLGHRRITFRSDNVASILVLNEAARRESGPRSCWRRVQ